MPALQNRSVEDPDTEGADHLDVGQRVPDKKTADEAKRVKDKAPPKQTRDSGKEIGERR